jgi:hypothetical protein
LRSSSEISCREIGKWEDDGDSLVIEATLKSKMHKRLSAGVPPIHSDQRLPLSHDGTTVITPSGEAARLVQDS